jgi:hypothetical protein
MVMKSTNNKIILISFLMIVPSWVFSIYLYPDENFLLRILHDSKDVLYYPFVSNFLELNLKPVYDLDFNENIKNGIVAYPIFVTIILSFFWFFFGPLSIVIIQLISVFLSIKIFYNLSIHNNLEKNSSLFISVFLISFTFYLSNFLIFFDSNFLLLIKNNLFSFYNLRFPRPVITNLFLFTYVYLSFKIFFRDEFNHKNFIFLGIISGITAHIFHYFFVIQNILLVLLVLNKTKLNLINFIIRKKNYFFSYIFFISIFLLLFILNSFYFDNDYYIRLGPVELDFDKKIILLKYFQSFILNKFFIIIFLLNLIFYYINKKFYKFAILEYLHILFFSSILSPVIFFIVSTKIITIYHFFNWILIFGVINVFFFTIFFLSKNIRERLKKKIINLFIFCSILMINLNLILNQLHNNDIRDDRSNMINFLINKNYKDQISNKKFLVQDERIFLWMVMNGYNNFDYIPQEMWTVRSNDRLEKDMIRIFKFFNLDVDDFNDYIKNDKKDFRMMNRNAYKFLGRKYYANKLKTFEDTDDYENYDFIRSIRPSISHSFAIPRFELNRLLKKFQDEKGVITPDYVLVDKYRSLFFKNFNNNNYCIINENDYFILFKLESCN